MYWPRASHHGIPPAPQCSCYAPKKVQYTRPLLAKPNQHPKYRTHTPGYVQSKTCRCLNRYSSDLWTRRFGQQIFPTHSSYSHKHVSLTTRKTPEQQKSQEDLKLQLSSRALTQCLRLGKQRLIWSRGDPHHIRSEHPGPSLLSMCGRTLTTGTKSTITAIHMTWMSRALSCTSVYSVAMVPIYV